MGFLFKGTVGFQRLSGVVLSRVVEPPLFHQDEV